MCEIGLNKSHGRRPKISTISPATVLAKICGKDVNVKKDQALWQGSDVKVGDQLLYVD